MSALQNTLLRPKLDEDVIPFSEYRQNLTRYFKQTQKTHRPILVTQNGRASAIVMNVADFEDTWNLWESLRAQLELRADVEAGIRELNTDQGIPHDKLFKNSSKNSPDDPLTVSARQTKASIISSSFTASGTTPSKSSQSTTADATSLLCARCSIAHLKIETNCENRCQYPAPKDVCGEP